MEAREASPRHNEVVSSKEAPSFESPSGVESLI